MKLFPVVAAFSLHAVVAIDHDSNVDLASDSSSGVMSFEEFAKSQGFNIDSLLASGSESATGVMSFEEFVKSQGSNLDSLPASESESMPASASGSGSMEFETTEDTITYIANIVDEWAPVVSKIMGDWAKPNSVEFKKFQMKMNKINALVADAKEMSGSGSDSISALVSLLAELWKEMGNVNTFVNDFVQNVPMGDGSLSLDKFQEMLKISELAATTEGSNKWPITQTSVDSATQSSPSAQKTKNNQTESEPAEKSTK